MESEQNKLWYLQERSGKVEGPFQDHQILRMAKEGGISAGCKLKHARRTEGKWLTAAEVPGIGKIVSQSSGRVAGNVPPPIEADSMGDGLPDFSSATSAPLTNASEYWARTAQSLSGPAILSTDSSSGRAQEGTPGKTSPYNARAFLEKAAKEEREKNRKHANESRSNSWLRIVVAVVLSTIVIAGSLGAVVFTKTLRQRWAADDALNQVANHTLLYNNTKSGTYEKSVMAANLETAVDDLVKLLNQMSRKSREGWTKDRYQEISRLQLKAKYQQKILNSVATTVQNDLKNDFPDASSPIEPRIPTTPSENIASMSSTVPSSSQPKLNVKTVEVGIGTVTITDKGYTEVNQVAIHCNNGNILKANWRRNAANKFGYDLEEPTVTEDANRLAVILAIRGAIANYLNGDYD